MLISERVCSSPQHVCKVNSVDDIRYQELSGIKSHKMGMRSNLEHNPRIPQAEHVESITASDSDALKASTHFKFFDNLRQETL
jgi:hypothetical protein